MGKSCAVSATNKAAGVYGEGDDGGEHRAYGVGERYLPCAAPGRVRSLPLSKSCSHEIGEIGRVGRLRRSRVGESSELDLEEDAAGVENELDEDSEEELIELASS